MRRVELACFLAGTCGKLADQVFVGIAQGVAVRGKLRQPFGYGLDDGAKLFIAVWVLSAELIRCQVDFREQALEGAFKGFVFNVLEAFIKRCQQFLVLSASHFRNAAPKVLRLDHIMHFAAHLLFKFGNVVRVAAIPELQRRGVGLVLAFRVV